MSDRIKLAEAMDWKLIELRDGTKYWQKPHEKLKGAGQKEPPDPLTDANDDYAVLEWARSDTERFSDFKDAMYELGGSMRTKCWIWQYQTGDYARAALKVLNSND